MSLDRLLAERLQQALPRDLPDRVGVAVSGGGDSMALLDLMLEWGRDTGRQIFAITIDHGLRPEARAEAEQVAAFCVANQVPHAIRTWTGWDGSGNLQANARHGRQSEIGLWAAQERIDAIALGHTSDDQAETVLMRLARGSGIDGLAAMAPIREQDGITWLRPLLGMTRAELRDYLRLRGIVWNDDPSNEDMRFDRVKARAILETVAPLGLTPERLNLTAYHMGAAQQVLEDAASALARVSCSFLTSGEVLIDTQTFGDARADTRARLLAAVLAWVSGATYRPRFSSLSEALGQICNPDLGLTLHGCCLRHQQGSASIRREPARVAGSVALETRRWDNRWLVDGARLPKSGNFQIGALGEAGLEQLADWRASGIAREVLVTTPAIWEGTSLFAAPLAGLTREVSVTQLQPPFSRPVEAAQR